MNYQYVNKELQWYDIPLHEEDCLTQEIWIKWTEMHDCEAPWMTGYDPEYAAERKIFWESLYRSYQCSLWPKPIGVAATCRI